MVWLGCVVCAFGSAQYNNVCAEIHYTYSDILAADTCHLGCRYEACGDEEALGPREEGLYHRQHGPLQPRDRCGGLEGVKEGEDQT